MCEASLILIIIPAILILLNMLIKGSSYIDLGKVLKEHLMIFKDYPYQYMIFYFYPLLISVGIVLYKGTNNVFLEQENLIISILLSALLAIMGILISKDYDTESEVVKEKIDKVLKETNNAIIFSVTVGIILLMLNIISLSMDSLMGIIKDIITTANYYLFLVMLLNILLIIKRLGNLLT